MNWFAKPKFFSEEQMNDIHSKSLDLLSTKGVIFKSEEARKVLESSGARVDGEIVYIPETLVSKCLERVPSSFRMDAVNPERAVTIGGDLIIHPAGGEVFLKDADENRYSSATIANFSDLQKIYQACDNINMTGYQPLSPDDVPLKTRGLHCLYETMLYTDKPWLAPMDYVSGADKHRELQMYEIVFGSDYVKDHYLSWSIVTPESPLQYSEFSCESIMEYAGMGQPVALVSAPMSGLTGPIHLLGTIILSNTETLAGLVLAQCVKPGVPVLPSASLTYGNMKLATWECASPDSSLMLAGAIQMYKDFYHLPARAQTGVTSSKKVDYQAGYETMQSLLLTALMDVDVTSQSAGSLENLMTISFEKTVIDDEIIARVRRIIGGIPYNDETSSMDIIKEVPHGESFLKTKSTMKNFRKGWAPEFADWNNYDLWQKQDQTEIEKRAQRRVREIIDNAKPLLDASTAKALQDFIAGNE
ncbi:MAG: trimethylamine methyltransferase family protein [Lachnospiraceae bacterium]|nr:trimethylamine methyltransferase family protein [Lachnospiraceae bacterium]